METSLALLAVTASLSIGHVIEEPAALQAAFKRPNLEEAVLRQNGIVTAAKEPCEVENAELYHSDDKTAAVVQVSTGGCRTEFFIPFWKEEGEWRKYPTIRIENQYGEPLRTEIRTIVVDYPPAIIIHGALVDRGTGVSQYNILGYMLVAGAPKLVLDRTEKAHLQMLARNNKPFDQEYRAALHFIDAVEPSLAGALIREVRQTKVQGRSIVDCRELNWIEEDKVFREVLCIP